MEDHFLDTMLKIGILKTYVKRRLDVTNIVPKNPQFFINSTVECQSALPCQQPWAYPWHSGLTTIDLIQKHWWILPWLNFVTHGVSFGIINILVTYLVCMPYPAK